MRALVLTISLISLYSTAYAAQSGPSSLPLSPGLNAAEFNEKLDVMLERAEKSVQLLRDQILQNQSAPFLANLYMQLGDMLTQKSAVLYYLQMERDKNTNLKVQETKKFSPVVVAQQEAITVYRQILKDFPKFDKLEKVMYRLAIGLKAIDEKAGFEDTAEKLIKAYPKSKEAIQVTLLLGQHLFDMQDFRKSRTTLESLLNSTYPYERNAARYRLGLIGLLESKHAEALKRFEEVATDNELKEEDNPTEISLKTKGIKSNIKREALIDSVRAYTEVYKEHPEPVVYYARVAPTEVLFQETIEKLSYRYIFLKKYNESIQLLRTLSERTSDPQKVMNIYHEVLLLIPAPARIQIPVSEIRFVLEKYSDWTEHFNLSTDLRTRTYDFFETQVREMGTRSHDLAKSERDPKRKSDLLARAKDFYLLYLGFFDKGPKAVKIATNLADVYFNQKDFLESGSYYLRVFGGEFGSSKGKAQPVLLQNAILALQKPTEYAFYEQLRAKGLLVKAIQTYQSFDKKKKTDPQLNFTLAKTIYEQGNYDQALKDLLQFMKTNPKAKEVESAADLILFYFNTRGDFKGLAEWTGKMLATGAGGADLNKRLKDVRSRAFLKRLDEQVKTQEGYDVFSQGKSYLQTALTSQDSGMKSEAFKQALARSRAEKDVETFIKTASLMAKAEKDPKKRGDLHLSTGEETLAITRFYRTLRAWKGVANDGSLAKATRQSTFERIIKLNLMLRDFAGLSPLLSDPMMATLPDATRKSVLQAIAILLESAVDVPIPLLNYYSSKTPPEESHSILFKAQFKMPVNYRKTILQRISDRCKGSRSTAACKWSSWPGMAAKLAQFQQQANKSPTTLPSVEPMAKAMSDMLQTLKSFEASGDPQLDILLVLTSAEVYGRFGMFLERVAKANPQVAPVLKQKALETFQSMQKNRSECRKIVLSANLISPTNTACRTGTVPSLEQALRWPQILSLKSASDDPMANDIQELQKKLFLEKSDWKVYFDLAENYLNKGFVNHAAATALYGMSNASQNEEEFNAILGCAVLKMGIVNEAQFLLKKASEINGHKLECSNDIKNRMGFR